MTDRPVRSARLDSLVGANVYSEIWPRGFVHLRQL